jgi:hypothetical protein
MNYSRGIIKNNIVFFAFFILVLLQSITFELLKTWIGILYFYFALASTLKILNEINFFNLKKR